MIILEQRTCSSELRTYTIFLSLYALCVTTVLKSGIVNSGLLSIMYILQYQQSISSSKNFFLFLLQRSKTRMIVAGVSAGIETKGDCAQYLLCFFQLFKVHIQQTIE